MYKIAVCDDNPADADYVADIIRRWAQARAVLMEIERFPSAEAFWFQYEENRCYDILFLDIEMEPEGMNGIELAAKLRKNDSSIQLVFVTGYMEYIADGYDVEALHYLLKPVTGERLGQVLDRALERIRTREHMLWLTLQDGVVRLSVYEIRYLEVMRNYTTVHGAEDYSVKRSLNDLERELDGGFYRIHRSFIVNLRFVKRITRTEVILKDGTALPLSRKHYEGLNQALIAYF